MSRFLLYVNTVRYLKLKQVFYQLFYRLCKPRLPRSPLVMLRKAMSPWPDSSYLEASTTDGVNYTFLGKKVSLCDDWHPVGCSKLWIYNLHYQDVLNAKGAREQVGLGKKMVDAWIAGNPPLKGDGWEPYCLSLRIVNWVKFFSRLAESEIKPEWVDSLATQAGVLEKRLEFHILANHLFANAKALVFVGVYLGGKVGNHWLRKGLQLLDIEVREQFLEDGAHYERSPMYQATLLWDIADLLMLSKLSGLSQLEQRTPLWKTTLAKGICWQRAMVHPDRGVSFFNDATFGVAPSLDQLEGYAKLVDTVVPLTPKNHGVEAHWMKPSGFGVIDWPDGHRLLVNLAPIGPDYQPGHAHADTLSCELSLFGQRLLVNSGISEYGEGPGRNWQRSTAAHNTVEVNGENSSEVWAGFRVARRARPFNVGFLSEADGVRVYGSHSGYHRLCNKVTHSRSWHATKNKLLIEDRIKGKHKSSIANWYFHPSIEILRIEDTCFLLKLEGSVIAELNIDGGKSQLLESEWYPGFGCSFPNKRLEVEIHGSKLITLIKW